MAAAPGDKAVSNSTRAVSLDPPRSRSDSMEDADSNLRKRPRLDDGNRTSPFVRSLSADPSPAALPVGLSPNSALLPQPQGSAQDHGHNPALILTTQPPAEDTMDKPLLHRSSSKVTINTKSPTVPFTGGPITDQESPAPGNFTEPQHETEPTHDEETTSQDPSVSDTTMQMAAPTPISVSSSPRSPEIEVAEVEDMDQDPSDTVWSNTGEDLVISFPWPCMVQEISRGLTLAQRAIRGTGDGEEMVVGGLRQWLHNAARQNLSSLRLSIRAHGTFWDELSWKILDEFLLRNNPFGQEMEQWFQTTPAFSTLPMFEEMLTDMARLILQLVEIDRLTLEKFPTDTQEVPDLISPGYLGLLEKLLSSRENSVCPPPPLYVMLFRNYGTNWLMLVHSLGNTVCDSPLSGISRLTAYARQILRVNPKPSHDHFMALVRICGIMNNILQSRVTLRTDRLAAFQEGYAPPVLMQRAKAIYEFIQLMDPCYQEFIVKLNQNLTSEWNKNILDSISEALSVIAEINPKVMAQIADDYKIDTTEIEPSQQAGILKFGWMFHRLHKCITKGRMELRAQAVDIMQDKLVNVFHLHIKGAADPGGHPLVQYLVNFIREVKIIDYIIGVESHTQLMSRSANIIGFLLVTNEYKDEDTDKIWSVIMDSEDSRATTAILQMLDSFFRTSELQPVLYLASKLLDVPIRRFDKDFTDFARNLLMQITKKYQQEPQLSPDNLLYKVCIRLLRDAISTSELVPERKIYVQHMARGNLEFLVQWPLNDNDKHDIYGSCIRDIEQKNSHASSALRTLNCLLTHRLEADIILLSHEFDFPRLFVEELAQFVELQGSQISDNPSDGNCFQDRLEILSRIVNYTPNTLDAELGQILWDSLYASKTLTQIARDPAWIRLIVIIKAHVKSHTRNSFLDRCMNEFLPQLTPTAFDAHVLTFAKESIRYETNLDPPPPPQEGETVAIPSVERLWNILINVPSGKIAVGASDALVELYLDNRLIMEAPPTAVEATHVAIVDECVKRLTTAAAKLKSFSDGTMSGEDEPMIIVATEEEMKVEELRFSRSLLFLKEFLQGLRKRPRYSTLALQERPNKGEIIDLLYECYDGPDRKPRQNLRIGDLDTLRDLKDRLIDVSGFANLQAWAGAVGKIDFVNHPSQTIRDRKLEKAGLLLVRNAEPTQSSITPPRRQSLNLVDSEILKHFEELYDLLGLEDKFSKEIHDFLIVFSPQPRVRGLVQDASLSDLEIFPPDKPYKILFSIYAMLVILTEQYNKNDVDPAFFVHCINTIGALLTRHADNDNIIILNDRLAIAYRAVRTLSMALKVSAAKGISGTDFPDPEALVDRLLRLLDRNRTSPLPHWSDSEVAGFMGQTFSCLVYASILHSKVWEACQEALDFDKLLDTLLLSEPRPLVRKSVSDVILNACNPQMDATLDSSAVRSILKALWDGVVTVLPKTMRWQLHSEAIFGVALSLLRNLARNSDLAPTLPLYIKNWSDCLLNHHPFQFVGKPTLDPVTPGFIRLIHHAIKICFAEQVAMDLKDLRPQLIGHYLFPEIPDSTSISRSVPRIPMMNPETRNAIYGLLAMLCIDKASYWQTLGLLDDLIVKGEFHSPPNLWDVLVLNHLGADFAYDRNWEEDRSRILRTEAGYAGLRNLSNTCYVNSLFAQLFMNVSFREFILNATITNSTEQRLLFETQKVFALMQDSWLKYVDMQDLADAILTYEMEPIDVTIQMDVGEFYALLFHRLESQILSADDQAKFRAFYAGQLVQQIKPKECGHVSEKIESFNSIQCEIKGKTCLEESLLAYVEGEIMHGDNKYSCTSCNKHVDAVKRACLKEIPDHLIIQLKRFDFDLNILQRNKVNDEFHFPTSIDMAPYKFETLNGDGSDSIPDFFELVGILIHSGSAETGHYYSYIKQRPVDAGIYAPWVEFNDIDVTGWDPSTLGDNCFGGWTESPFPPGMRFQKSWNAYMLFYQRVTDIEIMRTHYRPISDLPIQLPIAMPLANHITLANELTVRGYLLQDDDHAKFVLHLLKKMRYGANKTCTNEHSIERRAIFFTLDHVEQIIVKTEDQPQFEEILLELEVIVRSCARCALLVLDWNAQNPEAIRNVLMRNKREKIRQRFSSLFVDALRVLGHSPRVHMLSESGPRELPSRHTEYEMQFLSFVKTLKNIWGSLYLNVPAWDDYFKILVKLAQMGEDEVGMILCEGMFRRCLELILLEDIKPKKNRPFAQLYSRLLERKRRLPYVQVLELTAVLMDNLDLMYGTCFESDDRSQTTDNKWGLSIEEDTLLRTRASGQSGHLALVERLVGTHWPHDAVKRILSTMLFAEPMWGEGQAMSLALSNGMKVDPACDAKNYLEASVLYCTFCSNLNSMRELIKDSASSIESIGNSGGREHAQYLMKLKTIQNDYCPDATVEFFRYNIRLKMADWAPVLLTYPLDSSVRAQGEELVKDLLFDEANYIDDGVNRQTLHVGKQLAKACIEKVNNLYVFTRHIPYNAQIEEVISVIGECCRRFFDEDDKDDAIILLSYQQALNELNTLAVDQPEDATVHDSETILDSTSESEFDDEALLG